MYSLRDPGFKQTAAVFRDVLIFSNISIVTARRMLNTDFQGQVILIPPFSASRLSKHMRVFHARLYISRQKATHFCVKSAMPISQFGVRDSIAAGCVAKKISKWHKYLGCKMFDKICHLMCKRPEGLRHKPFSPPKP